MNAAVTTTRRTFLAGSALAAASLALPAETAGDATADEPRIVALELLTAAPLASMKAFYHGGLGLRVIDERDERLTIAGGATPITFVRAPARDREPAPFYHFAFNIPQNKICAARDWQRERSALLPIPPALRDPAYPDDVVNYSHWNAHSVFFFDPAGNVVEYIARHDVQNDADGDFDARDLLYADAVLQP